MATVLRRIASRPTLSVAIACTVLVMVVVISSISADTSVSLRGATAEVNAGLDQIEGELPSGAVLDSSITSHTEVCPDGSPGNLVYIDRSLALAPHFDASSWAADLAREYGMKDGWSSTVKTLGARDHIRVTLVNTTLLVYTVTTGSEESPDTLVLRAGSRCSRA
ncbi:MAG: hypothetical protein JWM50_1170 [Microbacteriaceae bacterium]|jgi:hypothetical protein|nr:hypothetical protein [Microbacteriaceae bacterium]